MSCPRVGHINFLNVLPLAWSYEHGASEGLSIVRNVPAILNNDIVHNRLDVSNVSSILYARNSENLVILPDVCVSTDGDVQSILLVSKKPIREITNDKIILTAKSATSHCLLKIILRMGYGAIPNYYVRNLTPDEPVPRDAMGSLFIGDDALWLYYHRRPDLYYYDLGKEWKRMTGKKMVYALWVANKNFAQEHPDALQLVYERIHQAFTTGLAHKKEAIESIVEKRPFTYQQLDDYLGPTIRWNLTDEYIEGLRTFYALAHRMNLIEHMPELHFANVKC